VRVTNKRIRQFLLYGDAEYDPEINPEVIALFNEDGTPYPLNFQTLVSTPRHMTMHMGVVGPVDETFEMPPVRVAIAPGEAKELIRVDAKLLFGTSIAVRVRINGVNAYFIENVVSTGWTTTTTALTTVTLNDGDVIDMVPSDPVGNPEGLSVGAVIEHTLIT
jgi:hypothetical protein